MNDEENEEDNSGAEKTEYIHLKGDLGQIRR